MDQDKHLNEEEKSLLRSISLNRIMIPVLLGVGVVLLMVIRQLDLSELSNFRWDLVTIGWLSIAILMYVARHLFYAYRLYHITDKAFNFWKCIELIVIWEFSSAISPTSVGGAGVAFLLLSQEKLPGEKTVTAVLYTMVLDTMFLLAGMIVLALILGPISIRPDATNYNSLEGYGITLLSVCLFMFVYGFIFYYGLFINPGATKKMLFGLSKIKFLGRFKDNLRKTAVNVVIASEELKRKSLKFHIISFLTTAGAWTTRFLALNFIILALIKDTPGGIWNHIIIFTRAFAMHIITSFSPTPGGAGVAEYLFGGFFSDYIPSGLGSLVALIWRLITYYPYLIAGAIIIPIWIRNLILRRKRGENAVYGD